MSARAIELLKKAKIYPTLSANKKEGIYPSFLLVVG